MVLQFSTKDSRVQEYRNILKIYLKTIIQWPVTKIIIVSAGTEDRKQTLCKQHTTVYATSACPRWFSQGTYNVRLNYTKDLQGGKQRTIKV